MKIRIFTLILFPILLCSLMFSSCSKEQKKSPRHTLVVDIIKKASPSVVNISTERVVILQPGQQAQGAQEMHSFVSGQRAVKLPSLGSGVIIDKDGLILTNAHVVQQAASTIFIVFSEGTKIEGKLVGINQTHDLAIIKIEPPFPLEKIHMAEPDDVMIGEPVIALGNPFGLSSSATTGIISAIHRDLYTPQGQLIFKDLIQTDTAINPGSSGGALLNMDGKLIGINQIVAQQAQGIGFAIPVKSIKPLLAEFRTNYEKMLADKEKKDQEAVKVALP